MKDMHEHQEKPGTQSIILAHAGDTYWLLQGEDHFEAFLSAEAPYPTPVFCVFFHKLAELTAFLEAESVTIEELWKIHPEIIARLERADELRRITPVNPA